MFEADRVLVGRARCPRLDALRPPGFQEIGAHIAQPRVAQFGDERFQNVPITVLTRGDKLARATGQ